MPRSIRIGSVAAFVMVIAGAASLSAQSQERNIDHDFKIDIDVDAIKAQVAAMKTFAFDVDNFEGLSAKMAELNGEIAKLEGNFQLGSVRVIRKGDEDQVYQIATRALDSGRWDEAVMQFQRVIAIGGSRADGAAYWTAWAQNKQGNAAAALEALTKLRQSFPNSKWITEGRALEVEIRQAAGQPVRPESVPDDELKLMALNSLMRADEQRAIPMVDKILRGTGSPRLKERALFVLAQNNTVPARQIVIDIAKGAGNPDLQAKAVTYLGALGGAETRQALPEIYKASTSVDVKRSILRAFMAAGDRARLLDVAKTETSADLRAEAVQQLGAMGAQEELSQLYQSEASPDVRKRIIQSMFTGHNEARLIQLLRSETEEDLKRSIVQNLGMMASPTSAEALTSVYASDKNDAVRRAVIDAFGQQRNSKVLIELAKRETDPAMKKRIVDRLSNMKSTEATDYFLELLSKP
jgi:HEAT repeat protein